MRCRRRDRRGAAAAAAGAALAAAGRGALAPAAFAGPAAEPAPLRGAQLRAAAASSCREAPAASVEKEELTAFRKRYPADPGVYHSLARQPVEVQSVVICGFDPRPKGLPDYTALLEHFISFKADEVADFLERYPVDESTSDLLAKQPVKVQSMVISNFRPQDEDLSDYSTLLANFVQTIADAARRPRQVATFSTGCFWESQRLFDAVSGVVNTTVGYTGGDTNKKPTYESVQLGDGHSEAIRIEFDPDRITYEELLTEFDRVRGLTPAGLAFTEGAQRHTTTRQSGTTTQYRSAVWYEDDEQKKVLEARAKKGAPEFHVARRNNWHDAEKHHQKFYQKGCCVQ